MNPQNPTTLGIRVPDRAIALHILAQTGPLATTSANRSGEEPLRSPDQINHAFPKVFILSPEELEAGERSLLPTDKILQREAASNVSTTPSTVAKWTGSKWQILRQGSVYLTT